MPQGSLTLNDGSANAACVSAEAVAALSASAGDPAWLAERRARAYQTYAETPLPDRAQHLWRYTDPESVLPTGFGPSALVSSSPKVRQDDAREAAAAGTEAGGTKAGAADAGAGALPPGLIVSDLASAAREHPELVSAALGQLAADADSAWTALNSACWRGGTFIYVPRSAVLPGALHLTTILGETADSSYFPRLLVVMEPGAELSLVDEQMAAPGNHRAYINATTELIVGDRARLRYAQVQNYGSRVHHVLTQRARLGQDASLDAITVALGARISKVDVGVELAGKGAATTVLGVVFGDGRQHFDHHTVLDHRGPHTASNLDFKVALANRASSAYTGMLRISETGLKADARQQNRNLLLSEGAKADSIPELEILTDDVTAAHGVAVGPLDAMQVFFCQSRGLSKSEAVHTIVRGFFEPIVAKVPADEVRERLRGHLDRKLAAVDIDTLPAADHSGPAATGRMAAPGRISAGKPK